MAEGVYLASTRRFVFDVTGPPGSGDWTVATRFYLLSADGRFHRGWDLPSVPGGMVAQFDFATAEADDPYNTGTYTVEADEIVFRPVSGDAEAGVLTDAALSAEQLTFESATSGRGGPPPA